MSTVCYVLLCREGEHEVKTTNVVAVLHTECDARWEAEHANRKANMLRGLCVAREVLMVEWEKHNPPPEANLDWLDLRDKESARLDKLLGISASIALLPGKPCYYEIGSVFYFVKESILTDRLPR